MEVVEDVDVLPSIVRIDGRRKRVAEKACFQTTFPCCMKMRFDVVPSEEVGDVIVLCRMKRAAAVEVERHWKRRKPDAAFCCELRAEHVECG